MASTSNVVRSLSADELASALPRRDRPPPPIHPIPQAIPIPEQHKVKPGLLKRLRRVLRLSAQNIRNSRHDKNLRSHPAQPPLYPNNHQPPPNHTPPTQTPQPPAPPLSISSPPIIPPHNLIFNRITTNPNHRITPSSRTGLPCEPLLGRLPYPLDMNVLELH
ncbi:hypothetical protein BWQ96_03632 [Gracilariopsis chorda]|uniref:Uncharacterized protein n=1 Tax=Gracilariopsis chorda TaxID=448386 RepID=A0A2V3IX57_9FLOR|nr:hypothetical protein BWQ96_03632 [Gracilariopsis chorda]|eukprot:PXF46643.1 hypothetical protein BWQ96_03632 [Gracilariopsis chorda]